MFPGACSNPERQPPTAVIHPERVIHPSHPHHATLLLHVRRQGQGRHGHGHGTGAWCFVTCLVISFPCFPIYLSDHPTLLQNFMILETIWKRELFWLGLLSRWSAMFRTHHSRYFITCYKIILHFKTFKIISMYSCTTNHALQGSMFINLYYKPMLTSMLVFQMKSHVQSMKELCGTSDMQQTVSIASVQTDVDSQEVTEIVKKTTFV